MVNEVFDQSPREIQLLNSQSDDETSLQSPSNNSAQLKDKVQMKKQLGLLEGVAIILGIIFGSGMCIMQIILLTDKNKYI